LGKDIMAEQVVLVDKNNTELGVMEKLEAHEKGLLHRAFSIFIFNKKGELLLQQRNSSKYHSGGLWSNTVCSHPRPEEKYEDAVHRRLQEEMGFDCELHKLSCIIYKAKFENGLTEHEYDCVFRGKYDGDVYPDEIEVEEYKWVGIDELKADMKKNPVIYTYWFKKIILHENIIK